MVRPAKRKKKKPPLMGSHQRCWIWGRMSVVETLRAARWPILELHLNEALPPDELHAAVRLAEGLNLSVSLESAEALSRLCRSDEHQGYLAKMPPFPYDDAEDLLRERPDRAFYVLLDAVQDPFNFGAILRSADALGVDAVFVAATNQVDVTSLVVRASAGAVNFMPLAKVEDLAAWISRLKEAGLTVVGTSPRAKTRRLAARFSRVRRRHPGKRSDRHPPGNPRLVRRPSGDPATGACWLVECRSLGRHPLLRSLSPAD